MGDSSGRRHHPPSSHMMMKTPLRLLIALAAYQCCTALPNTNAGDVVPETKFDQLPLVTAMSSVNQVRHLPANEIISFLQADDSQCRAVSTALKSEVNTLIASDQAAFNALDTGANCPSTFQTEVNSAQTAVNNAKTAVDTATQAQAAATGSSAPITITISFTTTPSVDAFTATPAWQAAQRTYNAAVLTGATKQGELDEARKNLVTAQSTQTEMVKACRCTAKAKYDLAVAQAQPHEAPNAASWRKAEEVICALNATSPCPSNPPANPTPPTLPAEVASVSQCKTTPATAPAAAATTGKTWGGSAYGMDASSVDLTNLVDISCGRYLCVALKADRTAEAWGDNTYGGSTKHGHTVSDASSVDLTNVVDISCGDHACVALKADGTAEAWGRASYGGDASNVDLTNVVDISCDDRQCVARKSDGTAEAWGESSEGGDASSVDLTNVVDISCGMRACVALKGDGTAEAWETQPEEETQVL